MWKEMPKHNSAEKRNSESGKRVDGVKGTRYNIRYKTMIWKEGVPVMNHFQAIRAKLEAFELDAMMLTNEANRLYATGVT